MIGLKEIESHPYMYLCAIETGYNRMLYAYAPHILMTNECKQYMKVTNYEDNKPYKTLLDVSILIKYLKSNNSIKDKKLFITDTLKSLPSSDICLITREIYEEALRQLFSYQYENKLLESTIIDYCPVVQYNQTIVKPNMENTGIKDQKINTSFCFTILACLERVIKEGKEVLENYINKLLYENCVGILLNYDKTIDTEGDSNEIFKNFVNKEDWTMVDLYYFLSAVYFSFMNKYELNYLYEMLLKIYNTNFLSNGEVSIESLINFQLESDLLLDVEEYQLPETNPQFIQDKKLDTIMDNTNSNPKEDDNLSKKYNLDILTSYLYNRPHFKHDNYTNSLFLSKQSELDGYSFLQNDILISEIEDEYICTPVIDIVDNYKMKLICLNKDGKISIRKI